MDLLAISIFTKILLLANTLYIFHAVDLYITNSGDLNLCMAPYQKPQSCVDQSSHSEEC